MKSDKTNKKAQSLGALHTHTHTHTHLVLQNVWKLFIKTSQLLVNKSLFILPKKTLDY